MSITLRQLRTTLPLAATFLAQQGVQQEEALDADHVDRLMHASATLGASVVVQKQLQAVARSLGQSVVSKTTVPQRTTSGSHGDSTQPAQHSAALVTQSSAALRAAQLLGVTAQAGGSGPSSAATSSAGAAPPKSVTDADAWKHGARLVKTHTDVCTHHVGGLIPMPSGHLLAYNRTGEFRTIVGSSIGVGIRSGFDLPEGVNRLIDAWELEDGAVAMDAERVLFVATPSGEIRELPPVDRQIRQYAHGKSAKVFVTAADGSFLCHDTSPGAQWQQVATLPNRTTCVEILTDGSGRERLLLADGRGLQGVWDVASSQYTAKFPKRDGNEAYVCNTLSDGTLAVVYDDQTVMKLGWGAQDLAPDQQASSLTPGFRLDDDTQRIKKLYGDIFAVIERHGLVSMWNFRSGEKLCTLNDAATGAHDVGALGDGNIALACYDGSVSIYEAASPPQVSPKPYLNVLDLIRDSYKAR